MSRKTRKMRKTRKLKKNEKKEEDEKDIKAIPEEPSEYDLLIEATKVQLRKHLQTQSSCSDSGSPSKIKRYPCIFFQTAPRPYSNIPAKCRLCSDYIEVGDYRFALTPGMCGCVPADEYEQVFPCELIYPDI